MSDIYLGIKFAFSYFTILPIKFNTDDDLSKPDILKYMILSLPLVGIILPLIVISIYLLLPDTWIFAILCSVLYMILYGFIHTEAIADVVDALYASHSGKDGFKVIKEPTIGAMGMLYSVSFLILKVVSLAYILKYEMFYEFIAISILSRVSILFVIYFYEFKSSFVNSLKKSFRFKSLKNVTFLYGIVILFLVKFSFFLKIIGVVIFTIVVINSIKNRLKFLNGDVLGMILELNELFLFLCIV